MPKNYQIPIGKNISKPMTGWFAMNELFKSRLPIHPYTPGFKDLWKELEQPYQKSNDMPETGVLNIRTVEHEGKKLRLGKFGITNNSDSLYIHKDSVPLLLEILAERAPKKELGLTHADIQKQEKAKAFPSIKAGQYFSEVWKKLEESYDELTDGENAALKTGTKGVINYKDQKYTVWREASTFKKDIFDDSVEIKQPLRIDAENLEMLLEQLKPELEKFPAGAPKKPKGAYTAAEINTKGGSDTRYR